MSAVLTCPELVPKSIIVSLIESAPGVTVIPVRFDPSTAGSLAEPSSCTILPAVVPTSTFKVADPDVAPPVNPVPATTAVMSPPPPPPEFATQA